LIGILSSAYGAAAAWRRHWYAANRTRRRSLARPVVSVGNLRVGGSGKTPVVARIARMLLESGERPAVLTRGYARRRGGDGVTVVSDAAGIRVDVDEAGDEPFMLARALPGVAVLVSGDRYLAGALAERRLGATVHILDDGFQHLQLNRDVDLLLVAEEDLDDQPLPSGRLREGLEAAAAADAALVTAGYDAAADRIARALRIPTVFRVTRTIGSPRLVAGSHDSVVVPTDSRIFVVSGIARPERFVSDLASAGWTIAGAMAFRDHHRFTARDVRRIAAAARDASSAIVLTTEKDAVRLAACDLGDLPIASVPLVVDVEPEDQFRGWLLARLARTNADETSD
jgi:tetraacyldisaccharide 4'-kinase